MNWISAPVIYCLLALSALLGITAGVQTIRLSSEKAAHATTKADNADAWTKQANLATRASELAREAEQANIVAALASKDQLDKAIEDGNQRAKTLADRVRSGEQRLRDYWSQSPATCGLPNPDAADPIGESRADLQAGSLERIDRTLSAAEARVTFLIQRYDSAVATCNGEN